jgi:hypothetical protein
MKAKEGKQEIPANHRHIKTVDGPSMRLTKEAYTRIISNMSEQNRIHAKSSEDDDNDSSKDLTKKHKRATSNCKRTRKYITNLFSHESNLKKLQLSQNSAESQSKKSSPYSNFRKSHYPQHLLKQNEGNLEKETQSKDLFSKNLIYRLF